MRKSEGDRTEWMKIMSRDTGWKKRLERTGTETVQIKKEDCEI